MADSHQLARSFGDDIAFRADTYDVDLAGLPAFAFMLRHAGATGSTIQRTRRVTSLVATGGRSIVASMMAHCQATGAIAERLGLGPDVRTPLQHNFARWDGNGLPAGVGGDDIAQSMRIVHVAEIVELFHRRDGTQAAVEVARERSGKQFDPTSSTSFAGWHRRFSAASIPTRTGTPLSKPSPRCGRYSRRMSWTEPWKPSRTSPI